MLYICRKRKRKNSLEDQKKENEKKIKYYRETMQRIEHTYVMLHRCYEDLLNNNIPD